MSPLPRLDTTFLLIFYPYTQSVQAGGTPQTSTMATESVPPAYILAYEGCVIVGSKPTQWAAHSEEFYWDILLRRSHVHSIFADDGGERPLIDVSTANLSQTPREQCEILGLSVNASDLSQDGPGKSVIVHGLVNQQQLNGLTGRVLPLTGRGSLAKPPTAPRIAVRLINMKTICCRPENISYHAVITHSFATQHSPARRAAALPATAPVAARGAQQAAAVLPFLTGPLVQLVHSCVRSANCRMFMIRMSLRGCLLPESAIRCATCTDGKQEGYVVLARKQGLSSRSLKSSVQLQCVGCLVRTAQAARVPANARSVEHFVEEQCMWPVDAYNMLTENPVMRSEGVSGSYKFY